MREGNNGAGFFPFLKNLAEPILDFLFPPRCPGCGGYVEHAGDWCPACLETTLRVRRLPLEEQHRKVLREVWAFGLYHGTLRDLLLPLKFKKRRDGLKPIHTFLREAGGRLPREEWMPAIVVPVPLFATKEKTRGGNQTELIFREWMTNQDWKWRRALVRIRHTEPQFGLSASQRAENIRKAFSLSEKMDLDEIRGSHVLLVDDIMTTGATLAECAQVLLASGALSVSALVLASDRQ